MAQISEDGKWMWNGTEWVPNEEEANAAPAVAEIPVVETPVAAAPACLLYTSPSPRD